MFVCLFTFSPVFASESCCKSEPSFWKKVCNVGEQASRYYEATGTAPQNAGEAAAVLFFYGMCTEPATTLVVTGTVVAGLVAWEVGKAVVEAVSE